MLLKINLTLNIMETIKKHFHLLVISLLVILLLPVAYYFLYVLPNFQKSQLELEKQKQENIQSLQNEQKQFNQQQTDNLNDCLSKAEWTYQKLQQFLFEKSDDPNCKNDLACMTVNRQKLDEIKIDLTNEKNECFKLYKN
jgi:capsular polysaccharide biosynthesis protein